MRKAVSIQLLIVLSNCLGWISAAVQCSQYQVSPTICLEVAVRITDAVREEATGLYTAGLATPPWEVVPSITVLREKKETVIFPIETAVIKLLVGSFVDRTGAGKKMKALPGCESWNDEKGARKAYGSGKGFLPSEQGLPLGAYLFTSYSLPYHTTSAL